MKKELKKNIYETVSTLRNLFIKMKAMLEEGTRQKTQTEKEIKAMRTQLEASTRANTKGRIGTSSDREREHTTTLSRQGQPPRDHPQKLYSEVVAGRERKKFKLTIRSRGNQTPDEITRLLKTKVNPTEIKVGITSLRPLRDGRIIIEVGSKKDKETLGEKIGQKCGEEPEVNIQRLRNPRLVLISIPNDTTLENVREILTQQNPELGLKDGIIEPKFCYTTKRGTRNLVIEVDSGTRNKLLQTKVKMGWTICKIETI